MKKIFLIFIAAILFSGCEKNENTDYAQINIFVSIAPLKFFTERIGSDRIKIDLMVMPGRNPATYEPTPEQVIALAEADLFFTIGVPFENSFIPKIEETLSSLIIKDVTAGIEKRQLFEHHHEDEPHETEKIYEYNFPDPHTWLSPVLAKTICVNILNALINADPEGEDYYTENYMILSEKLDTLHSELTEIFEPYKGKSFLVFHPSFGYLADQYGIIQLAIESRGKEPGPYELEKIIEHAKEDNISIIFTQPEFSKRSAEVIAESINGTVVILSTLNPDYINNLRIIAGEIVKELEN